MDIEKGRRRELMEALGEEFEFFEEATLRHAMFTRRTVRADIVAIPKDERLSGYAFAFEVKEPDQGDYQYWAKVVRQASDYVYASIDPKGTAGKYAGRRIAGSFVYPSPPFDPLGNREIVSPYVAPGYIAVVSGIFHLALHLRVGMAQWERLNRGPRFQLTFGPNRVWESETGFRIQGLQLITGKRTLGSQKVDVRQELDGWGEALDKSNFIADFRKRSD